MKIIQIQHCIYRIFQRTYCLFHLRFSTTVHYEKHPSFFYHSIKFASIIPLIKNVFQVFLSSVRYSLLSSTRTLSKSLVVRVEQHLCSVISVAVLTDANVIYFLVFLFIYHVFHKDILIYIESLRE